ncbi:hypothetical protein [Nocardioides sp. Soil796]|uniref:hypothetical protein n=1 Tax=Nocardioides sp. Soil796 TaxID=1736412 RepID=UPI00070C4E60|nr:hypothetical protein [Nocardioides sp. Soil796]KRF15766.1 hypothetical protein ASH02_03760 [Nocardioides sp. Soil796]
MRSTIQSNRRPRAVAGPIVLALLVAGLLAGCDSDEKSSVVAGDPAVAPSSTPTDDPSTDPTESPSTTPTDAPSTTDPSTTPPPGGRLTAAEYAHDWDFKLDGVRMAADHVRGKDYPDCSGLEVKGALTKRGCVYGVKVTLKALGGRVMITHMILEMKSDKKAKTFSNDKTLTDGDFNYQKADIVPGFDKGQWRVRSAGKYAVFTVVTGGKGVTAKQVKDYLHYTNADYTSALLWR